MNKLFALFLPLVCATACLAADATFKDISVADADALLKQDKSVVVLDVRTPDEFKLAHIPGAKNVNFNDASFKGELGKLDKSKTYLIHCQAGGRSAKAEKVMKETGFKSVLHLKEGFSEWESQGKPMEK